MLKACSTSLPLVFRSLITMWYVVPTSTNERKTCRLSLQSWAYRMSAATISPKVSVRGIVEGRATCGSRVESQTWHFIPFAAFITAGSHPESRMAYKVWSPRVSKVLVEPFEGGSHMPGDALLEGDS